MKEKFASRRVFAFARLFCFSRRRRTPLTRPHRVRPRPSIPRTLPGKCSGQLLSLLPPPLPPPPPLQFPEYSLFLVFVTTSSFCPLRSAFGGGHLTLALFCRTDILSPCLARSPSIVRASLLSDLPSTKHLKCREDQRGEEEELRSPKDLRYEPI